MSEAAVLVTGGAGYIGAHVVLALCDAGRRVLVLDNLSTGRRATLPPEVAFVQGEAADRALLDSLFASRRIGAVLHLAGSISAPQSVAQPAHYYRNNTVTALAVADACTRHGVGPLIFSSSAAVYGAVAASPIAEDVDPRPITPYGASKRMSEVMLADMAAATPGFTPLCLRYFNVGGADPAGRAGQRNPAAKDLLTLAIDTALGARPALAVCGDDWATRDGTGERDYIHVSDLAAAHLAALAHLEAGGAGGVINCGYGRGHTVLEVVAAVEAITGRPLPTERAPRRPGDLASAVSDVSRLRATLDWRPAHDSLEAILRTAMRWREGMAGQG